MKTVTIYGDSDDLIEVCGDIEEEFYSYAPLEGVYLHFDDGTVIKVKWNEDRDDHICWEVDFVSGPAEMERLPDPDEGDTSLTDNSQIVTLTGNFSKVRIFEFADGPSEEDVNRWLETAEADKIPREQWKKIIMGTF